MQRALVVSIHDVAPATRPRVERMLAQLAQSGVTRCSLLVVPDYHRAGRSLGQPTFAAWLEELQVAGHELVIHGYYHQRTRREGESARQKFITRIYTAGEGEFYDLEYDEAARLIHAAQGEFAAHGFHPSGFIAPAWLLSSAAERAARDAGLRYTTRLRDVRDLVSGIAIISQSLVYSVRSPWRCAMSLVWNRLLFWRLSKNPLLRLGLHPPDIDHPKVWKQITALVAQALRSRRSTTYHDWLRENSTLPVPESKLA